MTFRQDSVKNTYDQHPKSVATTSVSTDYNVNSFLCMLSRIRDNNDDLLSVDLPKMSMMSNSQLALDKRQSTPWTKFITGQMHIEKHSHMHQLVPPI